ncbi:5-methyltetrahydropteroyltriglutamate--homocysteine S-methyltransferase [Paenibacillus hemerocallicola]|uniref:5-methyltetrahydropteroyltriglutamate--homocysteine methyltransferase n=1 Tax=Paenibacillus hemerocallicola TaxID=1172614 RepID=A0A5C4T3W8_9BACL|nr:5-methyltetrahydropteroyltriglutamate--homocysteine S-methyltransferase [Paenibacillus hemerocallicola]TNJ63430.1 5-methyltetrahydropteroyltriglutamate--homocysteine S-methyltransferase [Paenibacillus hemerocallicola]
MNGISSSSLGYPRIGADREWKKALESFWAGKTNETDLAAQLEQIRLKHLKVQQEKGIDLIPVNDFTLYDHVLDMAVQFGVVPARFGHKGGPVPVATYFAMARGIQGATACEMTKWFNTNYHYIVPELNGVTPSLVENRALQAYREAKEKLGIEGKPVVLGLYTFLKLSKGYRADDLDALVEQYLPPFVQLLSELEQAGVEWVQIDEPILAVSLPKSEMKRVAAIYEAVRRAVPDLKIMLQTYFDSVEHYEETVSLPVDGIGLDFVHGYDRNLSHISRFGFPADKKLGAGVIDGRNIWRADLGAKLELIESLTAHVPQDRIVVQPSCSLLHVPVSTSREKELDPVLRQSLAYAEEKLEEIVLLVRALREGKEAVAEPLQASRRALEGLQAHPGRVSAKVREAYAAASGSEPERSKPFAERRYTQQERWKLPLLPTTTIGSFPQTAEVRQARRKWRSAEWNDEQYESFVREQIDLWTKRQEQIGLDVLVHGEFERTDMVEFFGEKLNGFAFTSNGWVQSYGSRCVKPPVIYGDVEHVRPMTVSETVYAQSLTSKPVKGMLTGPITILNWSFVRDDLPREQVAGQIALALREEVELLERSGIGMIQVDEPALREGLPLKDEDGPAYLEWAVRAFKLATSTVGESTQIHTHMCYCEFHDMIDSIRALDADVISLETSRSHGEMIPAIERETYELGIGLGVYDIHSPRVPPVEEMVNIIDSALKVLEPELFWVNPDCGLKTRGVDETVASLTNMVEAARVVRERLAVQ